MISQLVELQRKPITLLEGNKATLSEKDGLGRSEYHAAFPEDRCRIPELPQ